jgi:hypothetical protein
MIDRIFKNLLIVCALGAAFTQTVQAQGGSNYSAFGVGDIRYNAGAAFDAIGGTSIAVPSAHAINLTNPAAWAFVSSTRLQAGYRFNQQLVSSANSDIAQNNGEIDGILGIFSIDTALGLSASFGIQPYTSVNYLSASNFSVELDTSVRGKRELSGEGGLSLAYLGGSYSPIQNLALGASAFVIFGKITSTTRTTITTQSFSASTNERKDGFLGTGARLGAIYSVTDDFKIGASAALFSDPELTSTLTYYSSTTSATFLNPDTSFVTTSSISLPAEFGLGASFRSGKFLFAADALMQDFSGFSYRTQGQAEFQNALKFSAGISRLGNMRAGTSWLDKITYGIGGGYQQLYYAVKGEPISEIYGSFGLQMPIAGAAELDAAITGGTRGTTNNGLVSELFMRASFSVSIGETWFKPFAR